MTYQPPPLVNAGDPITAFVLNRYRLGLTQWEQFLNFSGAPDILFAHQPIRAAFWSYQASSTAEATQFNASWISAGRGVFVVMMVLNVGTGIGGEIRQTYRPTTGDQSVSVAGSTLRIYANGNVTLQHNTNALRKTAVLLVAI